ncbi:hypothetical protein MRX96_041104 [Rhipicephalus microplus]
MVFESREPSFEKLLMIQDGHSLKLTKASVLAEKLLLRDITESSSIDHYRSFSGRTAHKLSKLGVWKDTHDDVVISRPASFSRHTKRDKETKLELPQNFTIETVFISDLNHTKYFNNDKDRISYVSVLMLGIGLRFQRLDPPGRIALTAIYKCFTAAEEKLFLSLSSDGAVLGSPTLTKISNNPLRKIEAADIVYLVTQKSIKRGDNSKYTNSKRFRDQPGTYSGLHTAPHEIGHLLGCDHDGEKGSETCSGGYIMERHAGGKRHYEWSKCSKEAVKKFLQSPNSKCLHDIKKGLHCCPTQTKVPKLKL